MTKEKSLEQKMKEANEKLPGVDKMLQPSSYATWGMHWNGHPEDIKSLETKNYQIVAAKWDEHEWSEDGGGIQWNEWLSVHYKPKGSEENIRSLTTERIITRDMHSASNDRESLWPYNYVGIKALEGSEIEVSWQNEKGDSARSYIINLEERTINGIKYKEEK